MENTKITLYGGKRKRGPEMLKSRYHEISELALELIKANELLTIYQMLDHFYVRFPDLDRNALSKEIFDIKKDLEVRGIIKITFDLNKNQIIQLARKKYKALMPIQLVNSPGTF